MRRTPVKSKLMQISSYSEDLDSVEAADNNQPHCPTPRRLKNNLPEFLIPLRCTKHSQQNFEARNGILNLISDKANIEVRESKCNGCLTTCYSGSPPGRTNNPLVNDVLFHHLQDSNFLLTLPNPMTSTN
ncbi:hypothetical protein M5689_014123 [Euphorbia peplus]|nr:hypothetical protein M5689_014123 [Euphorbia peplus]